MAESHEGETETPRAARHPISRRLFLKGSSAAMAAGGIATASFVAGQSVAAQGTNTGTMATTAATTTQAATTTTEQVSGAVAFFNSHEAATVEALTARLLPGTADDPGAREAGVVNFIDQQLSGPNLGYMEKTYIEGPYPVTSETPLPTNITSTTDLYQQVFIPETDISRYGYQSVLIPQAMYRNGLQSVDAYANSKFGKDFIDLSEAQQDTILEDMEAGKTTGFYAPSDTAFFARLREDTVKGMFSDPMYGGNKNLVGWKLIGYPGARGFYTPAEIKNQKFSAAPQSLAQAVAHGMKGM